jgi:pyruvate,water dikinase
MTVASRPTSAFVVDLHSEDPLDPRLTGTKAATLARLSAAGFSVPDGFVLTTDAFRRLTSGLSDLDERAVRSAPLPSGVEEALLQISARMDGLSLAVRSSATGEDLADASYAGQYATVLGVRGPEALVAAVRECWSSGFAAHAQAYRAGHEIDDLAIAVIVQRQLEPRAAGVAFSADPVSGDRSVAVVNAVAGLGDRLAAGSATPEEWRVAADGSSPASGDRPVLTPDEALAVARLARDVEVHDGTPQDIEWALDGTGLWLLQARPITALPDAPVEPVPVPVEVPDGYWERDASHFPAPASPLGRSIVYPTANAASPELCAEFGMLAESIQIGDIGGWHYIRTVPIGGRERKPPPAPVLGLIARLHPTMRARNRAAGAVARGRGRAVIERWWAELQPTFDERAAGLVAVDLAALTDAELLAHFQMVVDLWRDGVRSHVSVLGAHMVEIHPILSASRDLFGWDAVRTLDLVTGLSVRSTEPARRLALLANRIRDDAALRTEFEAIDGGTLARLAKIDPDWAADFEAYRRTFGVRGLSRDPADATIADRPLLILQMIADQLAAGFDPGASDHANASRRSERRAEAKDLLRDRSAEDRRRFEDALARAERAYPLREDNVFVALQAPVGLIRYAALEVGRRLAERRLIYTPDDVFFLEYPEVRATVETGSDQRPLVVRRKGERAWVLAHPGPASYGVPPGPPPSLRYLPPELREVTEAFFSVMSLAIDPGVAARRGDPSIRGVAGSPGRYRGPVRVVMDEGEFDKIKAGDVVVCPVTQPSWSVMFPVMGAVVTDSGGVLSHPAIIAREYRIPAVVATGNATAVLRDGEIVDVDGSAGLVEIVGAA